MGRYIAKRLLLLIPIALGVSFLIFTILNLTPGDPADIILGANATEEAVAKIKAQYGLDKPFLVRYFSFIFNLLRGDLGTSYTSGTPVADQFFKCLPISLKVAFLGIIGASCIGIPIGILSAVKQYSLLDTIPTVIALFLAAVPGFWLGMMLMLIFSLKLKLLPSMGIDSWKNFILPMFALALPYAARQLRFTRSSMLDAIRQDYVRTARAKGASERSVIWKHALKNALLPIITVIGDNFSGLIGGAVVTESLFSIPGLGSLIVNGVKSKDIPTVLTSTLFLSLLLSFIQLIVDLLYAQCDPRLKARFASIKRNGRSKHV